MMDKIFKPAEVEEKIYRMWEEGGYFTPKIEEGKKPFTVLLPPPNASGKMHTGNVLMIAIEDLLIRWHRMRGEPALWLPGTDHAGTETQITFERELKKEGKSRFQFDRASLYQLIWDFVQKNKGLIEGQIKQMGASVDWSRYKFTLDPDAVAVVRSTFSKLAASNLVYRDDYIVNYCPSCGTTYADIEVEHKARRDPLYFMKYGPFTIATVRPETKFRDTALAVNPKDARYKKYIGQTLEIPGLLGSVSMTVIPDPKVDPKFGTGIMKVTPAHDPHDFELGKKFNLPVTPVIDLSGRMDLSWYLSRKDVSEKYRERAQKYHGKKVIEARRLMVEDLKGEWLLVKTDENYEHLVPVCKAGHDIEPTILPNWFIKVETLKKSAAKAVDSDKVKIYPKWRKITYTRWMEVMHDWAISRQNVWGIRIPAWYDVSKNPQIEISFLSQEKVPVSGRVGEIMKNYSFAEIESGLQTLTAPKDCCYVISDNKPGEKFLQTTETFDTWFSSGQWPLTTLGYPNSADFKYFYPTSVLETGWEILPKWVSRMIMFGLYLTGKPPFEYVYLHGIVRALDGRKMSKSLGNVIEPDDYLKEFGADALRMGLISGTANGRDFNFPRDKVIAFRNFGNKVWNIARFFLSECEKLGKDIPFYSKETTKSLTTEDRKIIKSLNLLVRKVDRSLENFKFARAGEEIYQFVWHEVADKYIENCKSRLEQSQTDEEKAVCLSLLRHTILTCLKLLHPFMPFVTEAIWQQMSRKHNEPLIISKWPEVEK
ncbi:MAG: valine--tRNA ligase [Patescibacteria group bacterium]|nr:valine--tRNA ligase [Patescibacteria group bacterium]